MTFHDTQYLKLVDHVLTNGVYKSNRTAVNTLGVFGYSMRFNLSDGTIPLLTTKKMHTKSIIHEIIWYLQGCTNIEYLQKNGVTIWDEWASKDGELGPVYGVQWRSWPADRTVLSGLGEMQDRYYIDQIDQVIKTLRTDPNSRRMIVSAWNVSELEEMALPPCHYSFQLYARPLTQKERTAVASREKWFDPISLPEVAHDAFLDQMNIPKYQLSLLLNQRSCDVGLGVPFNIVQYSILLRMFCEVVNMAPGELIWNGGDVHIYTNHMGPLHHQCFRDPYPSPTLRFARKIIDIDEFKYDDFIIENYESHPTIKLDVAV